MDAKQKPHDLRDDAYAPLATSTDINDKLAGAPSTTVPPRTASKPPATGTSVTPGQATEG
jgi:hypothetical protein